LERANLSCAYNTAVLNDVFVDVLQYTENSFRNFFYCSEWHHFKSSFLNAGP